MKRREALLRIAAIAVLPALASRHGALAAPALPFRPPDGPMVFTRRLRREMAGGAAIEVVRSFEIRFLPVPGGYRLEGRQTAAHVTAPQSLAMLAQMEENRQETGYFPLLLDKDGRIVGGPGGNGSDMGLAVDEAFAWIARRPLTSATRTVAQEFIIGLQTVAARITTAIPADLFTGNAAPLDRAQDLTMPDGKPGRVSVHYTGAPRPGGGLLSRAQRIVVTEAGGSARRSVEEWTLEPAPPGSR